MEFIYGFVQLVYQLLSRLSDSGPHYSAVILTALPGDQAALLKPIEQACHVGRLGNHALTDLGAGCAHVPRAAQDAKHVVLSGSQSVRLQHPLEFAPQDISRPQNVQKGLGLKAAERPGLSDFFLESCRHIAAYDARRAY